MTITFYAKSPVLLQIYLKSRMIQGVVPKTINPHA